MKEDTPESATAATISKDAVLNKEVVADETSKDDKAAVWVFHVSKSFT